MGRNQFFKHISITENVLRIEGVLHEYMYLIKGSERALLIDTGCGAGNIKEYVQALTDLPLTVMLTHGHFDHTGGSFRFEEVYIGQKEAERTPIHYHAGQVCRELRENKLPVTLKDMTPEKKLTYRWLHDGMIFGLGGTVVECILCPGHTPETYAVLLKKERLLLIGDACHSITYLFFDNSFTVSKYRMQLQKLKEREVEWDELLLSHPIGRAPKEMVDKTISVCDDIQQGISTGISFGFRGNRGIIARPVNKNMLRSDGILGNIIYNESRIF